MDIYHPAHVKSTDQVFRRSPVARFYGGCYTTFSWEPLAAKIVSPHFGRMIGRKRKIAIRSKMK
jgi:hypothetical protein